MLYKIAFQLSGKVVALHLDNNTVKAYLCNQGGTAFPFLSRLTCCILNMANKHDFTLIQAYISTHLNVEADFVIGKVGSRVAYSFWHSLGSLLTLASTWGGYVGVLTYQSLSALLHLEESTTFGSLAIECFQPSLGIWGESCVSSFYISSLILCKFLVEHVTGQLKLLVLVVPCWMGVSLSSHSPQCIQCSLQCSIVKNIVLDVLVGWVLKDLTLLHLTFLVLRDACCTDRGSLPQSVRQW